MATWRPPERIKYAPLEAPWPSSGQAEQSQLFQPIMVGSVRLAARTWVPAMVPWRASEAGDVTPAVLAWYERFARGRPAALVVEATGVRDVASGPLLRISDDRFLPGLERLTECVRRASNGETKAFHTDHRFFEYSAPPASAPILRALLKNDATPPRIPADDRQ